MQGHLETQVHPQGMQRLELLVIGIFGQEILPVLEALRIVTVIQLGSGQPQPPADSP